MDERISRGKDGLHPLIAGGKADVIHSMSKHNHIAVLTISRPEALNALCEQVVLDLDAAIDTLETMDDIYVVVLTGAGRSFVGGRRHRGDEGPVSLPGQGLERFGQPCVPAARSPAQNRHRARSAASRWAAAASWPWPATSASRPRRPNSASRRWAWASRPASAAPSACPPGRRRARDGDPLQRPDPRRRGGGAHRAGEPHGRP